MRPCCDAEEFPTPTLGILLVLSQAEGTGVAARYSGLRMLCLSRLSQLALTGPLHAHPRRRFTAIVLLETSRRGRRVPLRGADRPPRVSGQTGRWTPACRVCNMR